MNERVAVEVLLTAAVRYERSADSTGQTFSNWPDYQRAKAEECRKAASFLMSQFYPGSAKQDE